MQKQAQTNRWKGALSKVEFSAYSAKSQGKIARLEQSIGDEYSDVKHLEQEALRLWKENRKKYPKRSMLTIQLLDKSS